MPSAGKMFNLLVLRDIPKQGVIYDQVDWRRFI